MRLAALSVSGFRAFTDQHEFDLSADVLLVSGPNGTGKTSLFDAVLWALSGNLPRIRRAESVVSLYARSGLARVQLDFYAAEERYRVIRSTAAKRMDVSLKSGSDVWEGAAAEAQLQRLLWPAALEASNGGEVLGTALTRSVYLQQDLVRQFLDSDTDQQRFEVLAELVGAGP